MHVIHLFKSAKTKLNVTIKRKKCKDFSKVLMVILNVVSMVYVVIMNLKLHKHICRFIEENESIL